MKNITNRCIVCGLCLPIHSRRENLHVALPCNILPETLHCKNLNFVRQQQILLTNT